jgi:UPF0755 protein
MLSRFFYVIGRLGFFVVPFIAAGGAVLYWFNLTFYAPLDKRSKEEIYFTVENDWDINKIAQALEGKKIIRSAWAVSSLLQGKSRKGFQVRMGEYALSPSMTPDQVLDKLNSGELMEHQVVILPGAAVIEAAKAIAATELVSEKEAFETIHNPKLMSNSGVPAYIPEGYMMEGTYVFSRPITADRIVAKIIEQSQQSIDEKHKGWQMRAGQLGLQPYEFLTLASLIEKETSIEKERPKISSVFHNRLKLEMPLESRAALAYGKKDPDSPVTDDDIKTAGPYNTFGQNKRLPVTPICTPSHSAIEAALHPEGTDYLYFVRTATGSHDFAATLKQYKQLLAENGKGGAGETEAKELTPEDLMKLTQ